MVNITAEASRRDRPETRTQRRSQRAYVRVSEIELPLPMVRSSMVSPCEGHLERDRAADTADRRDVARFSPRRRAARIPRRIRGRSSDSLFQKPNDRFGGGGDTSICPDARASERPVLAAT